MAPKLKNQPVYYALAQVVFNRITKMKDFVPNFQETLRQKGFPDFQESFQLGFKIVEKGNAASDVSPINLLKWTFNNPDNTEGYVLLEDGLIFHTVVYENYEDFEEKLGIGLNLINEQAKINYVDRIGLRYLDAIVLEPGKEFSDFLQPYLAGVSTTPGSRLERGFSESVINIEDGVLLIKTFMLESRFPIPPDIEPFPLQLPERLKGINSKSATLDTDFIIKKRMPFSEEDVINHLKKSHKILGDTFKSAVTGFALETWA